MTFSLSTFARTSWYCAHPELCNLFQEIIDENHIQDIEIHNVVQLFGDPHEYEPTSDEIKNLIKVNNLIIGPKELNPWCSKINYQRIKNKSYKQIELNLSAEDLKLYKNATKESLSHFWLYPKIYCKFKNDAIVGLMSNGYSNLKQRSCVNTDIENKLKIALSKINLPIIVTHDALSPLLKTLSPYSDNIISLRGSGHHEEINSSSIKILYRALNKEKVIWIKEKNISIPSNILNKIRSSDVIIELDTSLTRRQSPFNVLNELEDKLTMLVNK
jgi:hypothetical protein